MRSSTEAVVYKTEMSRPTAVLAMYAGLETQLFAADEWARLDAVVDVLDRLPLSTFTDPRADALLGAAEILIAGWFCPPLNRDALARAPRLRLVANAAGTVRPLVTDALWERDIVVTSAAAANAVPVAEFTFAAIVFANKGAFAARDEFRAGRGTSLIAGLYPSRGSYGITVGLVGASTIGRLVIDHLRRIDAEVCVSDPYLSDEEASSLGVRKVELDELLASCDVVSLHAPALPETEKLIGAPELARMRPGATLINTARGALVDTTALEEACASGRVNAVLDVTDPEPLPSASQLWDLANVVITPHLAGSQGGEVRRLGRLAVDEVERHARGEPPAHPVTRADLDRIA
jgi:phosphoglycerate dehydrogenase-like enzyme